MTLNSRERSPSTEIIHYSWEDVQELCTKLAYKINKVKDYKHLLVVANGGLIPGNMLAYYLKIKDIHVIDPEVETLADFWSLINMSETLLFDDVCDCGDTFQKITNKKSILCDSVVLIHKPWSKVKPTYFGIETVDWVVLPWEF
jgi:hypoxanthine phosphoribosyltransferase